jgi:hypothetical protein
MAYTRRPARTTDTKDLCASLRSTGRRWVDSRVLNLSYRGMLVASSSDLEVADHASFELAGPDFCYSGLAEVAHRADAAIGLRFVRWEGPADRSVCALVDARLRGAQLGSHHADEVGNGHPAGWHSREYERAAIIGLSAVITQSPGVATSRHQLLNVSEQGMLIIGLALPVGAQISFTLSGRGINHIGHGHVAYRTDHVAGVAVDHWDGAPEAIRALISDKAEHRPRPEDAYITDWF